MHIHHQLPYFRLLILCVTVLDCLDDLSKTNIWLLFQASYSPNVHFQPLTNFINFLHPSEQADPQPWSFNAVDQHLEKHIIIVCIFFSFEGIDKEIEQIDQGVESIAGIGTICILNKIYQVGNKSLHPDTIVRFSSNSHQHLKGDHLRSNIFTASDAGKNYPNCNCERIVKFRLSFQS